MNEDKINSSTQLDKKKKQSKGFGGLFFCCIEKEDDDCNNNKKNTSSTTSRSTGPQSFVQLQTPSSINAKEGQQQNQQQKQQSPQQQLQFTQQQNQSTIFYQSQIYKNQGNNNYNNEDDTTEQKMMASSLDAGKIESTNKANEKKQIREAQLIHQQVKQAFPLDKMFFLRDRQNKFHSLAFCTQHFFQAPISQIQSSATRNIISNTNNLFRLGPSNTSELQKSKIINFNTRKNVQEVQDTHVKISQHIAELMKKYTTVIEAGCGQGNTTLQFSKTARIVIVVEKDMDMLMNCIDNVRMYRPEKNLNVEYICDEFLALDCPQQFALGERADLVFLKPQLFTQSDTHRLDLFRKNYQHELLDQMTHAYRLAKNMAVLLPHNIDIDQIPVLLDKFYDSLPLSMIEHHCAHIQVLYMNGAVKHFLLLIGDISKITADEEFQFMQEQIRSQSYYPRGPYEMRVLELLRTVKTRRGMKKLVNLLIKSIDLSDFQKQKNLLSCFVDELQKEKILLDKEVKRILNFSNLPASSDGLCDSFEGKRSPSGLTGNNGNNGNNNNNNNDQMHNTNRSPFVMSAPSDSQSQFEMEMQYGSRYSNSINNHNQSQGESLPVVSHTVSLQESEVNSQYKYVESSLGERLEFTDGEENEEYSDDEDGDHGGSHRKKRGHTSYKYEMDDSNIQHNQSGLDLDENSPHQQHNQKQNEKNLLEKNPPRPQLNSQINTF